MCARWPAPGLLVAVVSALALCLIASPLQATADDCPRLGGAAAGGECVVSTVVTASGSYAIATSLRITNTGRVVVPPTSPPGPPNTLTLTVAGGLVIEAPHGAGLGAISGDAGAGNPNGIGATISITTSGDLRLRGEPTGGATISSSADPGACAAGEGGVIMLTSTNGRVVVEGGARVIADGKCGAGAIIVEAPNGDIEVGGLVEAAAGGPGASAAAARGGPITVMAGGGLTVTGRISSRGLDAGADRVHLESGLDMTLRGVVESVGGVDTGLAPLNGCTARPGRPAGATACVEVWAGRALLIDGATLGSSVVAADVGGGSSSAGTCCGWVDVFARGDVAIAGPVPAPRNAVFALSARQGSPGAPGGQITVKSLAGRLDVTGVALSVDSLAGDTGAGGNVVLEAAGSVHLNDSLVHATGLGAGGSIAIRSFDGDITGEATSILDASGGGTPTLVVQGCGLPSYAGTLLPPAPFAAPQCGGAPSLPAFAVLPKPAPVVTITGGTFVETSPPTPFPATATLAPAAGGPAPVGVVTITYATDTGTPLAGPPRSAGAYVATASFAGDATYRAVSAPATIVVVPSTAPFAVISLTGGTFTYDDHPHHATGAVLGGPETLGLPVITYVQDATGLPVAAPVDAGTYTVTATDPGFPGFRRAAPATVTLTILEAEPTLVLSGGGTFVYDGNEHAVVGIARGVHGEPLAPPLTFLYGGSPAVPRDTIGTFPVRAAFAGNANYTASTDTSLSVEIVKATPTVVVTSETVPFTGEPRALTGTVLGAGTPREVLTPPTLRYDGSTTAPSASGVYTVIGEYPGNATYEAAVSAPATLTILGSVAPTLVVDAGPFTYDGRPHPATGQVLGTGGVVIGTPTFSYEGSPAAPVDAGSYTVLASFPGDTQYAAAAVTGTLVIAKATPVVAIGGALEVPFDGLPHAVTASVTGAAGETPGPATITYSGSTTPPSRPGRYVVVAAFAGSANYTAASATATLTITGGPRETCILVDFREITYFRDHRVLTSSDAGIRARNGLHGGFKPWLWPYDARGRDDSTPSRGTLFRIYGFAADQAGVPVPDADVAGRAYPVQADPAIPGALFIDLGGPARVVVCVRQLQRALVDASPGRDDDGHEHDRHDEHDHDGDRHGRQDRHGDDGGGAPALTAAQRNVPGIMLSRAAAVIDVPRGVRADLRLLGTPLVDARGRELDRGLVDYVAVQVWGGGRARYREFVDVQVTFLDDSPLDLAAHYRFGLLTAVNAGLESFAGCAYLDSASGNDGVRFTDVWSDRRDAASGLACGRREPAQNQRVRESHDVPFGAIQILTSVGAASDTLRLFFGEIRAPRR